MKTFIRLCGLMLLTLLVGQALSQTFSQTYCKENKNSLNVEQIDEPDFSLFDQFDPGVINGVIVSQIGEGNQSNVFQAGLNLAVIEQEGVLNEVILNQYGAGNQANLIQNGERNLADIYISGTDIFSRVIQQGNLNVVEQDLLGNDLNYSILQQGYDLQIYQTIQGSNLQGLRFTQKGANMKVYIVN